MARQEKIFARGGIDIPHETMSGWIVQLAPREPCRERGIWVQAFVRWYKHEHRHSGIGFVIPAERHAGHDTAILNRRHAPNEQARSLKPFRWIGKTRNLELFHTDALNPDRELVV